jgi:anti-sigma regulatory factor (Ser/Thr protein kinase)
VIDEKVAQRELIELSFPGLAELVVLARFTASLVAGRAGFDLEEIEDLRLAVDELYASFGPIEEERCVRLQFGRTDDTVTITCIIEPPPGQPAPRSSPGPDPARGSQELSEQLLDALVDEHGHDVDDGQARAWLKKRRGTAER